MRPLVSTVAAVFLILLISGCVGKKAESEGWQAEREQMMQLLITSAGEREQLQSRLDAAEQRLSMVEKHYLQHQSSISALEATMMSFKQESIEQANTQKKNSKKPKRYTSKKVVELSEKIAKIESTISEVGTTPAQVAASVKNAENDAYTAAYLALKSGRYEEASSGFEQLLKQFPQGEYADQAWYWLGESYYAQQKADAAIDAFDHVVRGFPKSAKYPAALLRLGYAYQERKRSGDAAKVFQRLIQEHPESTAAERARTRLRAIESGK